MYTVLLIKRKTISLVYNATSNTNVKKANFDFHFITVTEDAKWTCKTHRSKGIDNDMTKYDERLTSRQNTMPTFILISGVLFKLTKIYKYYKLVGKYNCHDIYT